MHINKANKSTKRLPPGQTQWQASFSETEKTGCSLSLSPSFLLPPTLAMHFSDTLICPSKALSLDTLCTHLAANSSFSNVEIIVMHYIRPGKWFCHFRKCWNKGAWGASVSKPAISVWHLFCLTVRQYQTHNIQYFAVGDSFSLYRITVLCRPNKHWGGLWKLSVCGFLVMTSHQQLMRIFIFFYFFYYFVWRSPCPTPSTPG